MRGAAVTADVRLVVARGLRGDPHQPPHCVRIKVTSAPFHGLFNGYAFNRDHLLQSPARSHLRRLYDGIAFANRRHDLDG